MKICAITMVYQDYWALGQWYRYYGAHLGPRNLYVISHGYDPEIQRICPDASVITIPRDELKNFDRVRLRVINGIQSGLGNLYDWVIQTDADELVCFDPATYSSFQDLFEKSSAPALFALGLNLAEVEGDVPLVGSESALAHRDVACVTGNYSKAWAVRKALPLRWHGVFCGYRRTDDFRFEMPDDVFFVHLKHANSTALKETNAVRQSVADSVGEDWNVNGWANPDFHAKRFYRKMAKAVELPWKEAVALGYEKIRENPIRDAKRGIVKPPFINYVCRTILPDWFKTL
ncbi:glycosyltransferase family 2 protein [uncultured Sulfitobacter sp.]|uniref:glycosyltransferase family 2 protein n=1 Tax=uncultured Sulfitobacter sp. TaxID=191468 RepID=UPI002603EC42|nr:glycosyltransferase family 2 protein [uncultured Sulfitobacter sp.]